MGGSYADTAGFGTFAALPEERISDKISRRILSGDQGMLVWWSIGAGVHVEPHSHAGPRSPPRASEFRPLFFDLALLTLSHEAWVMGAARAPESTLLDRGAS